MDPDKPRADHRTVLVHFGFSQPEQVAKWIKLGGIVSSNPYYVTALAGRCAKLGIGPERSANMAAHGDVVKNGGSLSFHSDIPMAPAILHSASPDLPERYHQQLHDDVVTIPYLFVERGHDDEPSV
jgi:hypothetical protein